MTKSAPPVIGVFTPFIGGFYLGDLNCALLEAARQKGARLLIVRTGEFNRSDTLYAEHQVDAWIVIVRALKHSAIESLAAGGKPVCCIAMNPEIPGVQPILSDNQSGILSAMACLHASGRRRFAFVGFLQEFDIAQRCDAYRKFLDEYQLEQHAAWVADAGNYEVRGGYKATDDLLKANVVLPDAILCGNDQNASGVIARLHEAGVRVPEDVAVVGYDDSSLARTNNPPMASVSQNSSGLAEEAIRRVLEGCVPTAMVPSPVVVASRYVPRLSSGNYVADGSEAGHEVSTSEFLNSLALGDEIVKFLLANPAERIHELLPRIDPEMRWCLVSRQDMGSSLLQPQHVFSPGCMVRLDRLSVDIANFPPLCAFEENGPLEGSIVAVMPVVNGGVVRRVISVGVGPGNALGAHRPLVLAHLLELLAFGLERGLIHEELESRVKLRTQELQSVNVRLEDALESLQETHTELIRSEKLASLGSLVAGVAHELNTPLGNSLMLSTTLEEDVRTFHRSFVSGEVKKTTLEEFVSRVREAAGRLTSNINVAANLVGDFKRLATQQHAETCQQFSLYELIGACIHQLRQEHLGVSLTVRAFDDVMMKSYPFALSECIHELVDNAIQHGLGGRKDGRVDISVIQPEPGWIAVTVADNGAGIDEAFLGRVFDPFFTTRMGMQRGLGLNTVFNFVTGILKGQISVESIKEKGARFLIRIPVLAPGSRED